MAEQQYKVLDPSESESAFMEQFEDAKRDGKWLAVVCSLRGDEIIVRRTTHEFPTGEFNQCLTLLRKQLNAERQDSEIDRSPLPLAPHLRRNDQPENKNNGSEDA